MSRLASELHSYDLLFEICLGNTCLTSLAKKVMDDDSTYLWVIFQKRENVLSVFNNVIKHHDRTKQARLTTLLQSSAGHSDGRG